jgi:ribosome biogenesis GTPase / thiamine phosphate phosphatase
VDDLARLGWDARWAQAAPAGDVVRVIAEHRGAYRVVGAAPGQGSELDGLPVELGVAWAELTGKRFHAAKDKRDLPTVGDWVAVDRWTDALAGNGAAIVGDILPRRTLLVRKAAGEKVAPQPLAANVDLGLIVTSANMELSPRRLERYLAVLRDAQVTPVIVLNKIDLVSDGDAAVASIADLAPELEVIPTCAISPGGTDRLRARVSGATSVLLGSSGVGKSTLLNRMMERDVQVTQAARGDDDKGRHTTTRRELFLLPEPGGVVIDTPGMRELGLWSDEAGGDGETLADFADVADLAAQCRFADCAHGREPGCAVAAAVAAGTLVPARVASYIKLAAEARDTGRRAESARRDADRRAGKVGARALREVIRRKYGDD